MELLARSIAGASILYCGTQFALYGVVRGFHAGFDYLVLLPGLVMVAVGRFILLRVAGLLPVSFERHGFEVVPGEPVDGVPVASTETQTERT